MDKEQFSEIKASAVQRRAQIETTKNEIAEIERCLVQLEQKHQAEQAELRARQIIELIDPTLKLAALSGKTGETIMHLKSGEWSDPAAGNKIEWEHLKGAARVVYDYCKKQGLSPIINSGIDYVPDYETVCTIAVPL